MCDLEEPCPVPESRQKKPCEAEDPKKCKEVKKSTKIIPPDCIEPMPPPVTDKVLFEEDSKDPVVQERIKCLEDCHVKPIYILLKECDKRVTRKLLYTAENCHEETIDLMEALDKCVKDKAFNRLA